MTAAAPSVDILGLPRPELGALLDRLGIGAVHTRAVFRAAQRDQTPLHQIPALGPRKARRLAEAAHLPEVRVDASHRSADQTRKLVFRMADGALTEGVLIPQRTGRTTFCVSSQVGCAMGCAFCATGGLGLGRGLGAGEIVSQVRLARAIAGGRLDRIVFMGMGEPLHHYEQTAAAIRVMTDHLGLMQTRRHITVSTVGLVPKIRRLADDFGGRIQLALSLNAGTDKTRAQLMPGAARWGLQSLRAALKDYPLPGSRRFLLVEYVVLAGTNDTEAELLGLAAWARGLRCVINLIPWNPVAGAPFRRPSDAAVEHIRQRLRAEGLHVTVRRSRGDRVGAACGQLALTHGYGHGTRPATSIAVEARRFEP